MDFYWQKAFFQVGVEDIKGLASLQEMDPMSFSTAEQRPGFRNIAVISVRTTILTTLKNVSGTCWSPFS